MIFVNFKTYAQASGKAALDLSKICEKVALETEVNITPVVQPFDVAFVQQGTQLQPWVQHIDPFDMGSHTGSIIVESAVAHGGVGTLLNHSEKTLPFDVLVKTVEHIREVKPGFHIMICVPDMHTLEKALMLKPDYIAFEPPELVGSTTGSVASEKSNIIEEAAKATGEIPLIVGAGIKSAEDILVSLKKGSKGILVSKAVVTADDQKEMLLELARAFTAY